MFNVNARLFVFIFQDFFFSNEKKEETPWKNFMVSFHWHLARFQNE